MKWFNNLNYIFKYIICITLLFLFIFLARLSFSKEINLENNIDISVTKTNIHNEDDNYIVDVFYPKFKDTDLNKIVTDWLYPYIKSFKESVNEPNSKLEINYILYNINGYANIFFDIDNSLNKLDRRKSILINLNEKKLSLITELYNEEELREQLSRVNKKYSKKISDDILTSDINDFNYLISEDEFTVYFDSLAFNDITYTPTLEIRKNTKSVYEEEQNKKLVAITFDDGPSEYSLEILDCLIENDSKATFFELGSRMKNNREITKKLYLNGMEIGNHTYSHKYLTRLNTNEVLEEINSTSILFNEITGDNIKLLRAPYGSVNSSVRNLSPFPIISWNIDTKDWLYKDPDKSIPIILEHVSDGDIILMHDVHEPTIELVKRIVPDLKGRGYELVTVSELAKIKNIELENGVVYRKIK